MMLNTRTYDLEEQQELRVEVDFEVTSTLKLTKGTAEIFGTELAVEREYSFSGTKFALFTWQGCSVELKGECHVYVGRDTPMAAYTEIHGKLEDQRREVGETGEGPRVMLVGPTDSGKSSISRLFINYTARMGNKVVYVDVDVGQGSIMPAILCSLHLDRPLDIVDPFSCTKPLIYFYGDTTPSSNPELYKKQIANMMEQVSKLLEVDPKVRQGGIIINTCGWVDGVGYDLIKYLAEATKATHILVLDHERLYNDLYEDLGKTVSVSKLQKSGGVVSRDLSFRRHTRMNMIRKYFYGVAGDLCPSSQLISFDDLKIYRVGGPAAPSSALPIGAERTMDPNRPTEITPSRDLLHAILGLSHAEKEEELLSSNIAGFLYVTDINLEKRKITVLSPCPGPLPFKMSLVGKLKWLE